MILLPQSPNKMRFKKERHSREHRDRVAAENKRRQRIATLIANYETHHPHAPITLPKLSILEDAE